MLPIKLNNLGLHLSKDNTVLKLDLGANNIYLVTSTKALLIVASLLFASFFFLSLPDEAPLIETEKEDTVVFASNDYNIEAGEEDIIGYFIDFFYEYQMDEVEAKTSSLERFLLEKQLLITKYMIHHKVARLDQLSDATLVKLSKEVSNLYLNHVLTPMPLENHVRVFFMDTSNIDKVSTAFVEQVKYHVPASITLAQAALETAYGRRVEGNNFFGIKDKSNSSKAITTTEYYSEKEFQRNKHKVRTSKRVRKGGKDLYKCTVMDHFQVYPSPWASFRAHSLHLSTNKRYSPLFTKGKNYSEWANLIGSTKYGGVGYATSPIYGELLKKVIRRYRLDLLDQ